METLESYLISFKYLNFLKNTNFLKVCAPLDQSLLSDLHNYYTLYMTSANLNFIVCKDFLLVLNIPKVLSCKYVTNGDIQSKPAGYQFI